MVEGWRSRGNNELRHTEAGRWKISSPTASWNLRRHLLALCRIFSSFSSSFQILYSASETWRVLDHLVSDATKLVLRIAVCLDKIEVVEPLVHSRIKLTFLPFIAEP
jgi:hypothetical protein